MGQEQENDINANVYSEASLITGLEKHTFCYLMVIYFYRT